MNDLLRAANALLEELTDFKNDLHRHPEASMQEHRTTALLRQRLTALGLEPVELGLPTGVVAVLRGDLPGPAVALRADIDAIPQRTAESGAVISETPGLMHACGHDFHTACLWGAARLLAAHREHLRGTVVFLFQPAEETLTGAAAMIAHGLWEKLPEMPRFLFGLHNRPALPTGQVAVVPGPLMAGKTDFTIDLHGRTGHGGSPHKCVDVIVAGAALVAGIQTVVSRNGDPLEPLVCAVCSIHSGTAENFAPDALRMTGSIRALNDDVRRMAEARVRQLAEQTAAAYRCAAEIRMDRLVPVLYNGPEATALATRAAAEIFGAAGIVRPRPDLGSEDFSVYGRQIPSFFYWLGTGVPGRENAGWHSAAFRTDDAALASGAALLAQSALTALGQNW